MCYEPLTAYRAKRLNENGKRPVVFNRNSGFTDMELQIPCGKCLACQLKRARTWAIRCMHEAQLHQDNIFITLTYSPENLPPGKTLVKSDFQKFMKRLRKKFPRSKGDSIRYYMCGEYGGKNKRPHYHAILFNFDFPDKVFWRFNGRNDKIHRSEILEALWPQGFSEIGSVTMESAGYVARYVQKKVFGEEGFQEYNDIDYETGEITNERVPEYSASSKRPAIGKEWYERYKTDIYNKDFFTFNGVKFKAPRYYDNLYELENPSHMRKIKNEREVKAKQYHSELDSERLEDMKYVKTRQTKSLIRSMENDYDT